MEESIIFTVRVVGGETEDRGRKRIFAIIPNPAWNPLVTKLITIAGEEYLGTDEAVCAGQNLYRLICE